MVIDDENQNNAIKTTADVANSEKPLDPELAEILGVDPEQSNAIKVDLHSSILNRWIYYYSKGMKKEDRAEILGKYKKLPGLAAPQMNPELKLTKDLKAKNGYLAFRQNIVSSILSSLGLMAENIIKNKEKIDWKEQFQLVIDAGIMAADVMHSQNKSRMGSVMYGATKETRANLQGSKPDEYLFGKKLVEKTKENANHQKLFSFDKKGSNRTQNYTTAKPLNTFRLQGNRSNLQPAGYNQTVSQTRAVKGQRNGPQYNRRSSAYDQKRGSSSNRHRYPKEH